MRAGVGECLRGVVANEVQGTIPVAGLDVGDEFGEKAGEVMLEEIVEGLNLIFREGPSGQRSDQNVRLTIFGADGDPHLVAHLRYESPQVRVFAIKQAAFAPALPDLVERQHGGRGGWIGWFLRHHCIPRA